ncbi:MAG: LptF/LptG family permease [Bacteroidales bacterium]
MIEKLFKKAGLKTLDMYIIRKFLGTFFFSITLLLAIVIVFDLSEKMEDFMEHQAPWTAVVFNYYFNFLPYFAILFMPLFVFIAVIFFTSKLTSNSEVVAILSSGVSYPRLMRPYFISALFLAIFSFVLTGYVIPPANKVRIAFEMKYVDDEQSFSKKHVHKQISPGQFAYIETYEMARDIGYRFSLEKFEDDELVSKLIAERVQWDSLAMKWKVSNYYIRNYKKGGIQEIKKGVSLDTAINLHPKDFKIVLKSIETLNTRELDEFIDEQQMRGDDNLESYKVERYRRLAFPFSTFILTLIGVSLSTRKRRGGTGLNIAAGIALSFIYILFMQVFTALARANSMPSLLAVWIPNIIFFVIGFVLYLMAPK